MKISEKEYKEVSDRIKMVLNITINRLEQILQINDEVTKTFYSQFRNEKDALERYNKDVSNSKILTVETAVQIFLEFLNFGVQNLINIESSAQMIKSEQQWHSLTMDLISQQCFIISGITRRLEYYNICVIDFDNFWGFSPDLLEEWLESMTKLNSVDSYEKQLAYHIYSGSNVVDNDFFAHKEKITTKKGIAYYAERNSVTEKCGKIISLLTRLDRLEVRSFLCDFLLSQLKIYKKLGGK